MGQVLLRSSANLHFFCFCFFFLLLLLFLRDLPILATSSPPWGLLLLLLLFLRSHRREQGGGARGVVVNALVVLGEANGSGLALGAPVDDLAQVAEALERVAR